MDIYRCDFTYPSRLPHSFSDIPQIKKYQVAVSAKSDEEIRHFFEGIGKNSEIWAHLRLKEIQNETIQTESIALENLKSYLQKIVDMAVRV